MREWCGFGLKDKEKFEESLEPERLALELKFYKKELGEDFTFIHLLKLYDLKTKAMLAAAITDFPELLLHQIGVYERTYEVPGIGRNFERLSEAICEAIYEGRFDRNKEEKEWHFFRAQ